MTSRHAKCHLCGYGPLDLRIIYPHDVDALFANSEIDVAQRAALAMKPRARHRRRPRYTKTGPCRARINTALNKVRLIRGLVIAAAADAVTQEKIRCVKTLATDSLGAYPLSCLSGFMAITVSDDLLCISLHNCLFLQVWVL